MLLTVNEVNLPPVASNDDFATQQDTVLRVAVPGILTNDSDPEGHSLTTVLLTQPVHGHLVPSSAGGFDYYPDTSYVGLDSFDYQANDSQLDSNSATVRIRVIAKPLGPQSIPLLDWRGTILLIALLMAIGMVSIRSRSRHIN